MSEDVSTEQPAPAAWHGRPWLFALILLAALAVIGGVVVLSSKPRLYVDPGAVGDDSRHREIVAASKPAPAKDETFLESLTMTRTNDRMRVEFPRSSNRSSSLLGYQIHRIKAGDSIPLAKGPFQLKYQSIGYGEFEPDKLDEWAARVKPRHFDVATGLELDEETAKKQLPRYERDADFRGVFPKVKFFFAYDPEEEIKIISYSLFDARTKASLSGGYSWGDQEGMAYVEMDMKKWHAGPVELVVDLAIAPVEHLKIRPEEGGTIRQPEWDLHLAAVAEGDSNGSSSGSNGTNDWIELRFRQRDDDRKETTFMFLGDPWAYHLPLDLEARDKNGKKISDSSGGSSNRYVKKSFRASLEEIDHLRATVYQDVRRIVIELPVIHGLPEENDNLSNLFDTRVPYLRIKRKWEFREAIEGLTQTRFGGRVPPFNPPAGYFPVEFRDVTPRDLLNEYLAYGTMKQAVAIDEEKRRFVLEDPLLKRLGKKIGDIFKK